MTAGNAIMLSLSVLHIDMCYVTLICISFDLAWTISYNLSLQGPDVARAEPKQVMTRHSKVHDVWLALTITLFVAVLH